MPTTAITGADVVADAVDGDGCMEHGRYIISRKTIPSHPMAC